MDYTLLTTEHKRKILSDRLLEYEAQHYKLDTEASAAAEFGMTGVETTANATAEQFAKLIEFTKSEIDQLDAPA